MSEIRMLAAASQRPLHRQTRAESGLDGSRRPEAARCVEAFRVRIADHVQDARGTPARDIGAVFDQQSSKASFPQAGLDEQGIELGLTVWPLEHRGKADDHPFTLRHEHVASRDLLDRQRDRVWIRK